MPRYNVMYSFFLPRSVEMIKVFAVAEEFGAAGCVCERVEPCGNETPAWAEPVRRALRLVARRTPWGEAQAAVWKSEREPALLPSLPITPCRYEMRLTVTTMLRPTVACSLVWSSATSVPCLFAAVACVLQGPHWGGAAEELWAGPLETRSLWP
jgi:hypothetical protein